MALELQYYVDKPGRDLSIPDPGSWVWVDVEPGCFVDMPSVRDQGSANTAAGMKTGIYTGRWIFPQYMGDSTELADYPCPLWHAAYEPPDFASFQPYNGWVLPELWQFYPDGYLGVNADLSITPDGRLFADISNYSSLTPKQARYFKLTLDGVIIGLQDAAKAREFKALLA